MVVFLLVLAGCADGNGSESGVISSPEPSVANGEAGPSPTVDPIDPTVTPTSTADGEETGSTDSSSTAGSADEPAPPDWADVDFLNHLYALGDVHEAFVTVDGEFDRGEIGDEDFLSFSVVGVDYGDIGGGDLDEAVVTIAYYTGGTGQFSDVLVYAIDSGEPVLLDRAGVGDRGLGGIARVVVEADELVIDRSEGQAACCPDRRIRTRFRLDAGRLVAVSTPVEGALIFVTATEPEPPEIKFLRGTTSAFIVGDVTDGSFAILEAGRGQLLTLTVDDVEGLAAVEAVELVDDRNEVLLSVRPGGSEGVTLPYDGFYSLHGATGSVAAPYVEFELSIR